jgi:hypothetical protein
MLVWAGGRRRRTAACGGQKFEFGVGVRRREGRRRGARAAAGFCTNVGAVELFPPSATTSRTVTPVPLGLGSALLKVTVSVSAPAVPDPVVP